MNYIRQLNAFFDYLQRSALSSSAQLLYHTLLMINNTCGWTETFKRTNQSLCGIMGMNEKTLIKARNELKQHNLIDFKPGKKKGEITEYWFIKLYENEKAVNKPVQNTPHHTPQCTPYRTPQRTPQCTDIVNININSNDSSSNINAQEPDIIACITKEFRRPISPMEYERIKVWIYEDNLPGEIVIEAVRRASLSGNCFINYIEGTLAKWRKLNIATVEQIEAHEKNFKRGDDGGTRKRQTSSSDSEISKVFDRSAFEYKTEAL